MGNSVIHKYLMTTGYLWTSQFPESSLPVKEGRPQSMELQEASVKGQWKVNPENGLDFFIINDAVIQKICILGDDVEPCFEGASITAPGVSTNFTLDDTFKHTLFSMMQDLKNALDGGVRQMDNLESTVVTEEVTTSTTDFTQEVKEAEEVISETTTEVNEIDNASVSTDYIKEEEKEEDNSTGNVDENKEEESEKDKESAKKYEALEADFNTLKDKYAALETEYQKLVEFKTEIDNQKKDTLIAEFYMLSDEDKSDVISNKEKYTLDEIKAKLSVICFDKKINFALKEEEEKKEQEDTIMTYTLGDNENGSLPEWVKAVKEQEKLG